MDSKGGVSAPRTEGARRAPSVRGAGATSAVGPLAVGQRWTAGRKREVVLRLLRGESLQALSRELGVEMYRLEEWRERALASLEWGLKEHDGNDPVVQELAAAKKHIGNLSMENELLREKARLLEGRPPLARGRSRR